MTITLLLGGLHLIMAQTIERSVIGAAGESVSTSNVQLDITIGETVTATGSVSSGSITQGFNQPLVAQGDVSVFNLNQNAIEILAYPNPVSNELSVKTTIVNESALNFQLVDQVGKIVSFGELNPFFDTINTSLLASSNYLLIIYTADHSIRKTLRFTKI